MQKFNGGEKVNKVKGYKFPGKVVAVFKPSNGEWRYVVEMDHYGLLHIFNGEQIEGELLEGGGTVEKCSCLNMTRDPDCPVSVSAHNKKEVKLPEMLKRIVEKDSLGIHHLLNQLIDKDNEILDYLASKEGGDK